MILALYVCLNLCSFVLFGWDKRASIKSYRRVSERTLLLAAYLGGALGAIIASQLFRHKTQKQPFKMFLWFALPTNLAVLLALNFLVLGA
ncbi:DUF1294 domain-containing protein [Maritalea porphyrae]|uniref:DUF1294 domain-containing protein n=1 Tax=Maritalea porphyrae TaxID=880732 RepID=A0ABQ5UV47_9HYPH|nr:hypothetical protein GCM10007879_32700 [Maritalea porphyrae]